MASAKTRPAAALNRRRPAFSAGRYNARVQERRGVRLAGPLGMAREAGATPRARLRDAGSCVCAVGSAVGTTIETTERREKPCSFAPQCAESSDRAKRGMREKGNGGREGKGGEGGKERRKKERETERREEEGKKEGRDRWEGTREGEEEIRGREGRGEGGEEKEKEREGKGGEGKGGEGKGEEGETGKAGKRGGGEAAIPIHNHL
eukprot:355679-Chlamydomonas_euryale.AAC.6